MNRFLVALRLGILTLSRSWLFLLGLAPSVLLMLLAGAMRVMHTGGPGVIVSTQLTAVGALAAVALFLFLFGLALLLGVIAVKRELRERSVKMLLCRPVGFHQWLTSRLLGGGIVLVVAGIANGAGLAALMASLGIDLTLDHAIAGILVLASLLALYAYAACLSTFLHEVPAALLAVLVNGPLFRGIAWLVFLIGRQIEAAASRDVPMDVIIGFFQAAYVVWPDTFHPTSVWSFQNLEPALAPFPPTFHADAAWSLLYALNLVLILYAVTASILKRRNLT